MKTQRMRDLAISEEMPSDDTWLAFEDMRLGKFVKISASEIRRQALLDFYQRVCDRAEKNMELTNTVSGAHWNAMKQVLLETGIKID